MAGVNKVIIVGNLGSDPDVRIMQNGDAVANISVATSETWKDKMTGETREATEWHRIVFYRRQAEIVKEYLRKGSKVYVEGRLKTRKWQDPQTGQDRYSTDIQGDVLQMLDSRSDRSQNGGYQDRSSNYQSSNQNSIPSYANQDSARAKQPRDAYNPQSNEDFQNKSISQDMDSNFFQDDNVPF